MKIGLIVLTYFTLVGLSCWAMDGSSGCGPGWYIAKDNSLVSSSLRSTTNAVIPVATSGMTSGTSNCVQHSIVKTEEQSRHFLTHNFFEVKSESAKGQGEYIDSLAYVIGCESSAHFYFQKTLQNNFQKIFPEGQVQPDESLKQIYNTILNDKILVDKCSLHLG
jgi:hypothetical protein